MTTTRTDFRGGEGRDTASYGPATAGVIVTKDGVANDGRTITGTSVIDRDNIRPDVERLIGSSHNDSLNASNVQPFPGKGLEEFIGGAGSDVMTGGPAEDFFEMGSVADGADIVRGGGAATLNDAVTYAARTRPVVVTVGHGGRDDGEAGELDDVSGVELVFGGRANDVISQTPGSTLGLRAFGQAGNDTLLGASGTDVLVGDSGQDFLGGGAGTDSIFAADGERDTIDCGTNPAGLFDSASTDASEQSIRNCENSSVGKLDAEGVGQRRDAELDASEGLAQAALGHRARARREREIGTVKIEPKRSRLAADGAVKLAHSKLEREGKTVSARLKLDVNPAFAGHKLAFEVEAVDVDGRRQVER